MPQTAVLSGNEQSTTASPTDKLDIMVKDLAAQAGPFARMPITEKIALLEQCLPRLEAVAARWVRRACEAKGLDFDSGPAAEEWLGGPVCTIRNTRLLIDSLKEIANTGAPAFGRGRVERDDDRVELKVFPTSTLDSALFTGFSGTLLFQDGLTESDIRAKQGEFYKKPHEGGVSLILGAGNVASIPPMDALYKSFVEGFVCVIKMNPVNEYLGPFFEEAFRPLIERNIWGVAFGGATEGRFLVEHDDVVDIHITGSDRTHDMIVWGPPGEERERRMKENDPVLKKRITSELGNVTPVVIVPGKYSPAELAFLAHNVASMVTNNGSFNCNAAKMIVLSKGWPQRDAFMSAVKTTLDSAPPRRAYYPGAGDRYEKLTEGRENVWKARGEREDGLQWAVIEHVDASDEEEALFQVEP
ncbi:MAG: aldehyde dehydrogenase, partial [Planctomycetota bacterium]